SSQSQTSQAFKEAKPDAKKAASEKLDPVQTGSIASAPDASPNKTMAEDRIIPQHAFAAPDTKIEPEAEATAASVEPFVATEADLPAEIKVQALRDAALQGDAIAYFEIANRFAEGRGVSRDLERAATWYERAAEK